MLGLGQQVDRDDERVGVLVGDDEDLGGPGEQVDADLAEQLALGLGDVGVARAGDQVDRPMVSVPRAMAATACTPPRT